MQNRNDILNELLEISRLMAESDNKASLYEVPANYFESFAGLIMDRIKNPAGSMLREIELLSPTISAIDKKKLTYNIPENYFESFAGKTLERIKASGDIDASAELEMLSPLLSKAAKKNPFTAPEGYFNDLSENLVSGLSAVESAKQELETIHPLMNDLKNKSTYTVPVDYFDQLPSAILNKIKKQPAKVVSFEKKNSWIKYAVAAMVTGVIFTIGILTFNNKTSVSEDPASGLSKVSDQEITNYLDNHDNPLGETGNNATAAIEMNENDVSELLGDVPDNELEQYASNHTGPKDLITN